MTSKLPEIRLQSGIDNYAVMGNPVSHSLSPEIHLQFARQTGQRLAYQAIEVPLDRFPEMVEQFRLANGCGLNITVPFKQQAWELADRRSRIAERAGAVNTLWFDGDVIYADNTDGRGLLRDITVNQQQEIVGKRLLILGAGGAVRGVLEPLLLEKPARLVVANRTLARAEELAEMFSDYGNVSCVGFSDLAGQQFDIVINGTSASLQGEVPPLPETLLSEEALCYDMMYAKEATAFVRWGLEHGAAKSVDGLGMLVEQAAESFLIWRGIRPDTKPVIALFRG